MIAVRNQILHFIALHSIICKMAPITPRHVIRDVIGIKGVEEAKRFMQRCNFMISTPRFRFQLLGRVGEGGDKRIINCIERGRCQIPTCYIGNHPFCTYATRGGGGRGRRGVKAMRTMMQILYPNFDGVNVEIWFESLVQFMTTNPVKRVYRKTQTGLPKDTNEYRVICIPTDV